MFISTVLTSCKSDQNSSDLIIYNAKIWTADPDLPSASAIVLRGDTIIYVGSDEKALQFVNRNTKKLDAQKQLIVPGFIDCHVHFLTGGFNLSSVQLREANTPHDFIKRIKEFTKSQKAGTWITGGDWDHERWGGNLPDRNWIDSITTDHPVFVNRLDGHMGLANSKALELAGLNKDTEEVEGGTIIREPNGRPTGVLKDNAMSLVYNHIPEPTQAQKMHALEMAMAYVAAQGVTSVHSVGDGMGELQIFEAAEQHKNLKTRIYAMLPISRWKEMERLVKEKGLGNHWLRIGALKGFVDGSLGSHTAAFLQPYTDKAEDYGFFVNKEQQLSSWIKDTDRAGLHVVIHAIGDSAIQTLLNIYEETIKENGPRDRRFRIEHAQHIAPGDIERFVKLGVIPSMQPYHAIDDGRWAEKLIGAERTKTTYAFRSLLDAGAKPAFGSDWFVAPPTPLEGIYAAVTRRTLDGKNPEGWVPEQKITVEEALNAYTIDAAYASFEEDIKGSLTVGKLGDLVMIDRDILSIDPVRIKDAKIVMTVVGGVIVYETK